MNTYRVYILFSILLLLVSSCMDDDAWYDLNPIDIEKDSSLNNYIKKQTGLFIINEGNFMYDNASLSYYMIDSMKVLNEVFFRTNALPLGDVAHSMTSMDSIGFVVVNNSGKIYALNTGNFNFEGVITGLLSPRYMHILSKNKAYVTDLYASSITIVDPSELKVTGSINVKNMNRDFYQHSTEQMLQYDNFVFVNCWSYDNMILVVDSETDKLVDSLEVIRQPNSMVLDENNKIWVLSDGGFPGSPNGKEIPGLTKIDAETREIEMTYYFGENDFPRNLKINGNRDTLYFINTSIFRQDVNSDINPQLFIKSHYSQGYSGGFYALGIDPITSEVYVADAIDNIQRGRVYRYKTDRSPVDTFNVGIIPGDFYFKASER